MKLSWEQCPLQAIKLAEHVAELEQDFDDAGLPEYCLDWTTWLIESEEKVVEAVGRWWEGLSEGEQRKYLAAEQERLGHRLELLNEALHQMGDT